MIAFSAALCAAAYAASWPVRERLVRAEFETSDFGVRESVAFATSAGRPLVALLGSSQTRRSLDALAVERALAKDGGAAPCVFNFGIDGLHPSAYPYALRRMLDAGPVGGVVMELGHIAQDQYGGSWLVRQYVEDESVREAFLGCARGRRMIAVRDRERWATWESVPRLARLVADRRLRPEAPREAVAASRGFDPVATVKPVDALLAELAEIERRESEDLEDASPQATFVAVARTASELCRARGVPFVVAMQPVNRELAARISVLRHFEEEARGRTVPALRAAGIDVLVPPEEFFAAAEFTDHVHLRRDAALRFTAWFVAALRGLPGFR